MFKIKNYFKLILIAIIFISSASASISLDVENPCVTPGPTWSYDTADFGFGQYEGGATVGYFYRVTGANIQVSIDWSSFVNRSNIVNDEALKKIITEEVVKKAANPCNIATESSVSIVTVLYKTDCLATIKTVIKLDRDIQIQCCDEGCDVSNEIKPYQGEKVIYKYKSVSYGTKCCGKVFNVKCMYDIVRNVYSNVIQSSFITSYTSCFGNSSFTDCLTGLPIPCVDGNCNPN